MRSPIENAERCRARRAIILLMHEAAESIDYFFRKDRLTRGWSYPLKRSRLDQALVEWGASNVASVFYSLVMTPLARRDNGPVAVVYNGEAMPRTHPGE